MDISHNGEAMTLRPDVVQKAVKDGIELWLFNTVISNREELHNLLTNELALDEIWVDSTKSYPCRNLDKGCGMRRTWWNPRHQIYVSKPVLAT
jgi:hypothetical protein